MAGKISTKYKEILFHMVKTLSTKHNKAESKSLIFYLKRVKGVKSGSAFIVVHTQAEASNQVSCLESRALSCKVQVFWPRFSKELEHGLTFKHVSSLTDSKGPILVLKVKHVLKSLA